MSDFFLLFFLPLSSNFPFRSDVFLLDITLLSIIAYVERKSTIVHEKSIKKQFCRFYRNQELFFSLSSYIIFQYLFLQEHQYNLMMMLGSKGLLLPTDAYELLRSSTLPAIL